MRHVLKTALLLLVASAGTSADQLDDQEKANNYYRSGLQSLQGSSFRQATRQFDAALAVDPTDAKPYFMRGVAKKRMGRITDARADFERGARVEARYGGNGIDRAVAQVQPSERRLIVIYREQVKHSLLLSSNQVPARSATATATFGRLRRSSPAKLPTLVRPATPTPATISAVISADPTDPFLGDNSDRLGQGAIEAVTPPVDVNAVAGSDAGADDFAADDGFTNDDGFGDDDTGFGADDASADSQDLMTDANSGFDDSDDGFGGDEGTAKPKKKTGFFKAALRAIGRSVTPKANVLENIPGAAGLSGAPRGPGGPRGGPGPGGPGPRGPKPPVSVVPAETEGGFESDDFESDDFDAEDMESDDFEADDSESDMEMDEDPFE